MKFIRNKKYKNVIVFIFFLLSYYLFFLSLEKCYEGEDICCMKMSWMKLKVFEESLSIFFMIFIIRVYNFKKNFKITYNPFYYSFHLLLFLY